MAGLYIHIPFCLSKCRYCDFTSFAGKENLIPAYIKRLCAEMEKYRGMAFDTVFIGGGTPSCLPIKEMEALLQAMEENFSFSPDAEMTCEMNPGTVNKGFLDILRRHGFNRASMGMQAKNPRLLHILGRTHTFEQVMESVALCKEAGFKNINLDLMFGIPTQTLADVEEALQSAIGLGANHVSCYGLIVEEHTPLEADIRLGKLELPDEETERAMYDLAIAKLSAAGLLQYEISNFAKPGLECRHNIGYWRRTPYLGLGLGAHSLLDETRFYNTDSLADYLSGRTIAEQEKISPKEAHFETLMLGLRMNEGVPFDRRDEEKAKLLIAEGLLEIVANRLRLTRKGMDVQNRVLLGLMDD